MSLRNQVTKPLNAFVRKGGKRNRRMQAKRILMFIRHCESLGAKDLGQVGHRHIISYYRSIRTLSPSTQLQHYYAIRLLWEMFDKNTAVPQLRNQSGKSNNQVQINPQLQINIQNEEE